MQHVAIDLGGTESQICVRQADGTILEERRWSTTELETYFKRRPKSRVIVEASAEAFRVADMALRHGHQARVVSAHLVRELGVGARRIKNDRRDAQKLSEVSCRIDLPSIHIPSELARERKAMCGTRDALVECRTRLVNTVRGWLRTQVLKLRSGTVTTFPERIRQRLLDRPEGIPLYVERLLKSIEALTKQIEAASKELEELAQEDPTCRRLMTVPGVGPVTAMRFVATLDQVERFPGSHFVGSYLGLTPGENSSSLRQQRTGITKAGSPQTRRVLVQACWVALRFRPNDPMVVWAKKVAERRGKKIAIVALARKLAGILFAIWRDGSTYNPNHAARASQEASAP
jgi:transposase